MVDFQYQPDMSDLVAKLRNAMDTVETFTCFFVTPPSS